MIMNQKIFTLDLSVEATSAYILICTMTESGTPVTIESVGTFWNDTSEALAKALEELNNHRVIYEALDHKKVRQYYINPPDLWETPAE
ncbi:MAG: hypothetical protein JSU72_02635 [Deltaproteobacteria bacterium]|nr:MAG: hypothetical protein JSU72_02635 [Deltaproteobacteria bacterium]